MTSGAAASAKRGRGDDCTVVAVDFGASSVRVCRVALGKETPALEVVHRYGHGPIADGSGHLRWDWARLVAEMETGLSAALDRGAVASIGIDTWGVDYGLLDHRGWLVAPPFSYRDDRTSGYETVVDRTGGPEALYALTGLQLQPFNTLFQVAAHDRGELARARHLLMLPELLVHHLTGEVVGEPASAGTTALVDITTSEWSDELAAVAGLDPATLPPIRPAGTPVGTWRGVPVHLVGGHDTASAVVALGARPGPGSAFVSAGTWLLVGQERRAPDLGPAARRANFSNEIGAVGGVRFLKNLAGAWLIEGCRAAWGEPAVSDLLTAAENLNLNLNLNLDDMLRVDGLDVADQRFLNPPDMLAEVTSALGLPADTPPPVVTRGIVEAQAAGTARVLEQLGAITDVYVFGGAQSDLYRRLLAERTGLPVCAGPVEATALGNALVQGITLGVYDDLTQARRHLAGAASVPLEGTT